MKKNSRMQLEKKKLTGKCFLSKMAKVTELLKSFFFIKKKKKSWINKAMSKSWIAYLASWTAKNAIHKILRTKAQGLNSDIVQMLGHYWDLGFH